MRLPIHMQTNGCPVEIYKHQSNVWIFKDIAQAGVYPYSQEGGSQTGSYISDSSDTM